MSDSEQSVQNAILEMADYCGKSSLNDGDLKRFVALMAPHGIEETNRAFDKYKADPKTKTGRNGKPFFPFLENMAKLLPKVSDSGPSDPAWFLPSGEWGGTWGLASKRSMTKAAAIIMGSICPGFDMHSHRRTEFLAMAEQSGCLESEIERLATIYREQGAVALNMAMTGENK